MLNSGAPLRDEPILPWTPKKREEEVCGGRVQPRGMKQKFRENKRDGKKHKAQMDVLLKTCY